MKRDDGAWMTMGEMAQTITNLRVQLDNANERIMKYEALFTETHTYPKPDDDLDEYEARLPV